MNGVLVVDKPAGNTSHDIVNIIRRIVSQKKVGHTGTLDPMATGVLVLLLGKATRIGRFLDLEPKEYIAEATFGLETDTQDITGNIIEERPGDISQKDLEQTIAVFTGEINQVPPMVSAIKIGGQTLYKLARQGIEVKRSPRNITISQLKIEDFRIENKRTVAKLRVVCSGGTYIRTLMHDIGRQLGIGATLSSLCRTRTGKFTLADARTIEALKSCTDIDNFVISMSDALCNLESWIVKEEAVTLLLNGRELDYDSLYHPIDVDAEKNITQLNNATKKPGLPVRLLDPNGVLLALGRVRSSAESIDDISKVRIQPEVVFK